MNPGTCTFCSVLQALRPTFVKLKGASLKSLCNVKAHIRPTIHQVPYACTFLGGAGMFNTRLSIPQHVELYR